MNFTAKDIVDKSSIGFFLQSQRLRKKWSVAATARRTLISEEYIIALEASRWSELPGVVYTKQFIKKYVTVLGFDFQQVWEAYEQELQALEATSENQAQPRLPLGHEVMIPWPKVIRVALFGIIAVCVFGYMGVTAYSFVRPPELMVWQPEENQIVTSDTITVTGVTDRAAIVYINTEEVIVADGVFTKTFDLQEGVNTFTITSEKKHGSNTTIERKVVYDQPVNEVSKK